MRVLIVGDEVLAAERLVRLCTLIDGVEVVGTAQHGQFALLRLQELRPDVLLLDISMPGLDGMTLAAQATSGGRKPAVVFVTAHSQFAVDAFALAATDYLLKPVSLARLKQALARVAVGAPKPTSKKPFLNEIWAPRGREMIRIATETLDLVSAERDYVRLHARGTSYLIRMALCDLESRLDPDCFVRVHRSTLVALNRIRALRVDTADGWVVRLSGGQHVRVGRSFRPTLRRIAAGIASDWM